MWLRYLSVYPIYLPRQAIGVSWPLDRVFVDWIKDIAVLGDAPAWNLCSGVDTSHHRQVEWGTLDVPLTWMRAARRLPLGVTPCRRNQFIRMAPGHRSHASTNLDIHMRRAEWGVSFWER